MERGAPAPLKHPDSGDHDDAADAVGQHRPPERTSLTGEITQDQSHHHGASHDADESGDLVKLTINDQGCGMDAVTLQKATQPFFSVRPAGRKRGMGLAYAARFVQLNKGSLDIESELGSGTAVTIYLPRK